MAKKRDARAAYYRGLGEALNEHIATTEKGIRALPGLNEDEIEKMVAHIHKQHKKLLKRLDKEFLEAGFDNTMD